MNCMALELPCAPLGHIMDMFSPRSLNTATGRPLRCKFTGVYVPSSSTPRLTGWSKSNTEDYPTGDVTSLTPTYARLGVAGELQEELTPACEDTVDLDNDSGHSSDISVEDANPDSRYTMPLASEAFETVMLELKDEDEAMKAALESDNSLSDCSDDSFDFGVHTVYSESPTLDRALSRIVEKECSQFCCIDKSENCPEVLDSRDSDGSDKFVITKRVRFADHVRLPQRLRGSENRPKGSKTIKPILKSPSLFH